ncbi:MAG: hypothetical protein LPK07_01150 [Hymenobacteraceae bacterium]|nr:hypothetical protein [Hymenobacteraceae bacterium]MDX5480269.1 hypothetical protein [Hymenobacteraceae bacterium]
MNSHILDTLQEYEDLVKDGHLQTFSIRLEGSSLLIQQDGETREKELLLPEELHTTLGIFFSGVESIAYLSFDYTTLKSLINAHECLKRMKDES